MLRYSERWLGSVGGSSTLEARFVVIGSPLPRIIAGVGQVPYNGKEPPRFENRCSKAAFLTEDIV